MSTNTTVRAWSTTAASNASADAAISSSDSQSPDTLDDNIRTIMAAVKRQEDDTGGALAAGGTANALTVTTNQVLESGQLAAKLRLLVRATADNTSATVTFAPDGLTAANVKRADGSALAVGSIKNGMYLDLVYNTGSSEWRAVNIPPVNINVGAAGQILLASGTVSAAATLDIVLTSYTAYRGLQFVLSGFLPVTNGVVLWMRLSTNGGSSYDAGGTDYVVTITETSGSAVVNTGNVANIDLGGVDVGVGSASTKGWNGIITLLNQVSTAAWPLVNITGTFMDSSGFLTNVSGAGARRTAQDTDAVRFLFSSGNISAGNYAVYGLV